MNLMTGIVTWYSAVKLSFLGWFRLCPHITVADRMIARQQAHVSEMNNIIVKYDKDCK